ncbi:MAG TPA: hypothetical protein VNJ46_09000, partial [Gaiellaceae bacterium]|nr:hypothetical protein [Gaiellaceae bacterium]
PPGRLADLVREMLVGRGHPLDDPVTRSGDEPELAATYLAARERAERAELGAASRADALAALDDLGPLFDTLAGAPPTGARRFRYLRRESGRWISIRSRLSEVTPSASVTWNVTR